jgi:DNA-directed RNA polymerase subunit K/omega
MVIAPLKKIYSATENKYKAIVVVAKEARRLNKYWKEKDETFPEKPTIAAIKRFLKGELRYKEGE